MKQGSTVCKHGQEPLDCRLCYSSSELSIDTEWEKLPKEEKLERNVIYFMRKWSGAQMEAAEQRAEISQLLELTKCNSLAEVAGLVIELRKK